MLQTRDQVPPGMDCVENPKLTQCPAAQLPQRHANAQEGVFFGACNKTFLFRSFGHCLQRSLVRKPSPCAPQRHLPWQASAFSLRINCDWPLQTPMRPYTFSSFWTHWFTSNIQRCRRVDQRVPIGGPYSPQQRPDEDSNLASAAASRGSAST